MIRQLIREMLLEDLAGFRQKTKDLVYMSNLDDATFERPENFLYKEKAKSVKRAWAEEADHAFMKSLIKIHWMSGGDWNEKLESFLRTGSNNEISAMGYLPETEKIKSDWGKVGVLVQGWVTLAANNMNTILSGYFKDESGALQMKYRSSGVPRRPLKFFLDADYVLDRETFRPESSHRNEFIVDNWKKTGIIIACSKSEFLGIVSGEVLAVRGTVRKMRELAGWMLKSDMLIYDESMNQIDKIDINQALQKMDKLK